MKRITLVGIYPPPIGGISVYIKRLKQVLEKKGYYCEVYNEGDYENKQEKIYRIKSYKNFIKNFYKVKGDIIHFNCLGANVRALLWIVKLFNKKKKIIITVHGASLKDQLQTSNKLIKYLIIKSFKALDKIIVVNNYYEDLLVKEGINKNKIKFISSFIKPIYDKKAIDDIPKNIMKFLDDSCFKIITNGCITFYDNEDLYGFDQLIEIIYRLKKENLNVKLLIAVLSVNKQTKDEQEYYAQLKTKVSQLRISNNVLFYEVENTEFYPLLEKSNLFIRATNTDGDHPISLKEALALNVPSIASDISNRPKQCITYKSRNIEDLLDKIKYVVNNYNNIANNISLTEDSDGSNDIIKLYEALLY